MSLIEKSDLHSYISSKEFFNYPTAVESYQSESKTYDVNTQDLGYTASISDYLVAFSGQSLNFCVGMVDMVSSTKITSKLSMGKSTRYYQVFLNSMSRILSRFGGSVIKNIGDSLLYYFPESAKTDRKFGFISCLECSLAMIEARDIVCSQLEKEGLPAVSYRVSSDYGSVVMMNSGSNGLDFIGPPLNICSKINRLASRNGIVLGGDLYQPVKKYDDYRFQEVNGYSAGLKFSYPVYSLTRKN